MSRSTQLQRFAEQDPHNPLLWRDLLDALLDEGRIDEAQASLARMPPALRDSAAIRFRAARCALLGGNTGASIDLLQALLAEQPEVGGIRHDLAYAQAMAGQDEAALHTLSGFVGEGDDAAAIAILKARLLYRGRHYAKALELLSPPRPGARLAEMHGLRALLQLDMGDSAAAAHEAAQALALDPEQHEALLAAATVALWERRLDVSTTSFERVLAAHPHSGRAWLGLGENVMLRGDVPAARALLERAGTEMPEHIGTWHALAWCQLMQGDLAGAQRSFERAFAIDRSFGETHGGFALVHALRSERDEAEEAIKRARRLDPKGQAARYAQSVLLLDEGREEEARRIIDDILARSSPQGIAVPSDFIYRLRELVRPRG